MRVAQAEELEAALDDELEALEQELLGLPCVDTEARRCFDCPWPRHALRVLQRHLLERRDEG